MKLFTEHPQKVGETYSEHFVMASSFGFPMILAGIACVLHGLLPFLFEKTGSNTVRKLHFRMVSNRADLIKSENPSYQPEWCI